LPAAPRREASELIQDRGRHGRDERRIDGRVDRLEVSVLVVPDRSTIHCVRALEGREAVRIGLEAHAWYAAPSRGSTCSSSRGVEETVPAEHPLDVGEVGELRAERVEPRVRARRDRENAIIFSGLWMKSADCLWLSWRNAIQLFFWR